MTLWSCLSGGDGRKMKRSSAPAGWRMTREQAWASVCVRIQIANALANQHIHSCFSPPSLSTSLSYTQLVLYLRWLLRRGSLKETVRNKPPYMAAYAVQALYASCHSSHGLVLLCCPRWSCVTYSSRKLITFDSHTSTSREVSHMRTRTH